MFDRNSDLDGGKYVLEEDLGCERRGNDVVISEDKTSVCGRAWPVCLCVCRVSGANTSELDQQ